MESNSAQLALHDRLSAWFEIHKRQVLWAAIAVTAAGLGTGFFIWRRNEVDTRANEALSRITSRGLGNEQRSEISEALVKVAAEYPNTDAGGRALLLAGASLFADSKYAEARAQFEKYLRDYRETPFAIQALLGVAACLELQGKTNEAVIAYKDIVDHHSGENVVPQAQFALARLYEAQNNLEQTRDLLLGLARPGPYSSISAEAGERLQELIAKHPDMAPRRPALTNIPTLNLRNP
jgi:tetratricopeptide (TPR) repeat protein